MKKWLTIAELENEFGFKKDVQAKMRMKNAKIKIPFSKIGRKFIRYDRLKIEKWLEDHEICGGKV